MGHSRLDQNHEDHRLRAAFDHSSVGMALSTLEGDLSRVNPAFCKLVGYCAHELLGASFLTLSHPDDREHERKQLQRMLREESNQYRAQKRYLHKGGHTVWVLLHISLVRDTDDNPSFFFVQAQDITEWQRTEERLRQYSLLAERTCDIIFCASLSGNIYEANKAAVDAYGYSHEELLSMRLHDLRAPETRSALESQLSETVAKGGILFETIHRRKDGSTFPVEVSAQSALVTDTMMMLSIVRDITKRKRTEDALRRSEANFRILIEKNPDAVAMHREGRFVYVNHAWANLLGYADPADIIGQPILHFVHPEYRGKIEERLQTLVMRGSVNAPFEQKFLRKDGSAVSVEVAGISVTLEEGEMTSVAMARDLTARKQMETQLQIADRMASVGMLAAGVAHEVNNPLAYTIMNLEYAMNQLAPHATFSRTERPRGSLRRSRPPPQNNPSSIPSVLEALDEAYEGAKRVQGIVQDLKTFSRTDEERRGPVNVQHCLESAIKMAWNKLRHRARLIKNFAPVPMVEADEPRLSQVFLNLLLNAVEALHQDKTVNEISVATEQDDKGQVVVCIRDNGIGIPAEKLDRIFNPFFTTKPIGIGTGLGLSICHNIVSAIGGHIAVESTVGKGTCFRLAFPSIQTAISTRPPSRPSVRSPEKAHVLVIDDEALVGKSIHRALSGLHDVDMVTSAVDALERIQAGKHFDVILCDLMMPDITGMEFYEALCILNPAQAERVLFLSGGAVTERASSFLEKFADRSLHKPITVQQLRAAIHRVCSTTA